MDEYENLRFSSGDDQDEGSDEKEYLAEGFDGKVTGYGNEGDPIVEDQDGKKYFSKNFRGNEYHYPVPGDKVVLAVLEAPEAGFGKAEILEIEEKTNQSKGDIAVDIAELADVDKEDISFSDGEPHGLEKSGLRKVRSTLVGLLRKNSSLENKIYAMRNEE